MYIQSTRNKLTNDCRLENSSRKLVVWLMERNLSVWTLGILYKSTKICSMMTAPPIK